LLCARYGTSYLAAADNQEICGVKRDGRFETA